MCVLRNLVELPDIGAARRIFQSLLAQSLFAPTALPVFATAAASGLGARLSRAVIGDAWPLALALFARPCPGAPLTASMQISLLVVA